MHWIFLLIAIVFEVAGTACMKASRGFTNLLPSVLMALFYVLCFTSFTFALKRIDVSVAYAIWSGVGMALITLIGIFYFHESVSAMQFVGIATIIAGVVILRLAQ